MATIEDDSTYTPDEVGTEYLRADYRTVLNEIHAGRLYALRIGSKPLYRIPGWALRDYLAGRAPQGSAVVAERI
jgi:excisionase family DNA binding protein